MRRAPTAEFHVRSRLTQIATRLAELRERREGSAVWLLAGPPAARLYHSSADLAYQARIHAEQATLMAVAAYRSSALVHDRAADLYDELADAGTANAVGYREKSGRHRHLADVNRAAAERESALR